jgi:beta-N-acetylhexosaminidase
MLIRKVAHLLLPRRVPNVAAVALLALLLTSGCLSFRAAPREAEAGAPDDPPTVQAPTRPGTGATAAPPARNELPELTWAERTLVGMSLREKVGQMIMPVVLGDYTPEGSAGHDRIVDLIENLAIGGLIVSVGSPTDVAVKLNDFQRHSRLPLLIAADLETGAGFRLRGAVHSPTNIALGGATDFPSLMALGATGSAALAYEMGRITAVEARAIGIHVPFAPVLDVNSNPDNPIINVRSFGEDPERVAELGAAFVRGIEDHGALATGKHFPGHGDTETDSHLGLPVIRSPRARLDAIDLVPFQRAVDAGMGGIMTAHIAIPALSGDDSTPATLSPRVMTDLLRNQMRFEGLLFTDAMDMAAIDRGFPRGEASVKAIEAGADVILMPPDVRAASDAILSAVTSGRLPEARIDESVMRILEAKDRLRLVPSARVSVDEVFQTVGIPAHVSVAEEVARRSITLLKNEGGVLPLRGEAGSNVVSVTYRRPTDVLAGRFFNARLRTTYPRLTSQDVDVSTPPETYAALLRRATSADLVVVSVYVTALSYSGTVAVSEAAASFIESLARDGIPHVVVSFGNPYLLREFPDARSYLLAWSGSEVSQRAAAGALVGETPIAGKTPTRIPPFFEIGDGIQLPARGTGVGP